MFPVIPAVTSAAQTLTGLSSLLGGNANDGERFAANQAAYNLAVAGDDNALNYLRQRTGQYGVALVTGYGEVGGWATETAKADAKTRYAQALAVRKANSVGVTIGGVVQKAAQATGNTVVPGNRTQVLIAIALGAVVVGAVAWLVAKRG